MKWNREAALKAGKARTRDGRQVLSLREASLDGKGVLIGIVTRGKAPFTKRGIAPASCGYWENSGLGMCGDDDLLNAPDGHSMSR